MSQTYTSAGTSVNSRRLPAVYRKFPARFGGLLLDYGCGKYIDHIRYVVEVAAKMSYLPYDPYNQPEETNAKTWEAVRWAAVNVVPVDVVCSNVLNVIDDDDTVRSIVQQIASIAHATGGTAYITVYEGDRSGIGRKTGPDQYQRNQPLSYYTRFVDRGSIQHGMIVIR